jgi:hypothetical protein
MAAAMSRDPQDELLELEGALLASESLIHNLDRSRELAEQAYLREWHAPSFDEITFNCRGAATILNQAHAIYRRASEIIAEPIRWLWPHRIARGKPSLIAGHAGLGKSQITASMAAIVSSGGTWPVDRTRCEAGSVVILSAEDDASDTIRPRLEAAGADLSRIYILDAVAEHDNAGAHQRMFNLQKDLLKLDNMLTEIGGAALVVIDPVSAYLGRADSHVNAEVRSILAPLGEIAAKQRCAIVCVTHLNKGGNSEALMRVTGSLAFVAAARAAYIVAKDQDQPERRLFLPIKNNVARDQTGLAFTVQSHKNPDGIETSRVVWEGQPVTTTADEVMAPQGDPEERSAVEDAKEFLTSLLEAGPLSAKQVRADAEGMGHSWAAVRRAKHALGVEAVKEGMKRGWAWQLPSKVLKSIEDAQHKTLSTFEEIEHLRAGESVCPACAGEGDCRWCQA